MHTQLIILAAGMGSRFGGLKQLQTIGKHNATIIDFSVFDAIRSGFNSIVFIIQNNFAHNFREMIGKKWENKIEVRYVCQELDDLPITIAIPDRTKPWGTGHALFAARGTISSPCAIINGDDFYGFDAFTKLHQQLASMNTGDNYCLVSYQLGKTLSAYGPVSRGICQTTPGNKLVTIEEYTNIQQNNGIITGHNSQTNQQAQLAQDAITSMNMYGFSPAIFIKLEQYLAEFLRQPGAQNDAEFYLPTAVNRLIHEKAATVTVVPTEAQWMGMTYKEDVTYIRQHIAQLIREQYYPENLADNHA